MIRVVHLADLHYCPKHLTWVDRAMEHAVDLAIAERADLAVIAGDSFDHALSVHEPAVAAYVRQVVRLAEAMPVVVLQGTFSHDRPGSLDLLKAIPAMHPIIVGDQPGQTEVAGALVSVLPSLNRADQAFDLRATLDGFAAANRAARAAGQPTLLVTHGTVTGCTTESGYAMVSPDHEFSTEILAGADADAVLLGHVHRQQNWPNVLTPSGHRTTIAYAGSLARLVHGHHDPVGFLLWTLDAGRAACAFHPSPARQLVEIAFDGPPDLAELRALAATVGPDDAVRVRWSVDEEHVTAIDKDAIRELFASAETLKLEWRVLPVQRVRAEGISQAITLADKLAHWAATTGSQESLPRLQDKLARLQGADDEQIVDETLNRLSRAPQEPDTEATPKRARRKAA